MKPETDAVRYLRVYMAAPLFTMAEREFNLRLAAALEKRLPAVHCILPQAVADSLLPDLDAVSNDCWERIRNAHIVLACLDGPDADSGTSAEFGFARGLEKHIICYRTDFRGGEVDGVNAMLRFGYADFINLPSHKATLEQLAEAIALSISLLLLANKIPVDANV